MSDPAQLLVDHLDIWTDAIERKSGSGRGNGGKISLYGIDKLRSLILDLAVRGKLVPQDPADGDAGELLPQIEAAAKKLIAKKAIRGSSNCWPLPKDQHWYELPLSWQWIALGSCTNYGYSDKTDGTDLSPDTWVLELEDVEKGTSRLIQKVRFEDRPFQSSKSIFEAGDVIYGKLRPYLDKVIVADEGGVCTTEMIPVRGHFGIHSRYLRLFLKSPHFVQFASSSVHGMNLPRLGTPKAREAPFPLPPLAAQKRIVAKVDELMTLVDALEAGTRAGMEAHETLVRELLATLVNSQDADGLAHNWSRIEAHFYTLFTTEDSIDALKQTVLELAVRGKFASLLLETEPQELEAAIKNEKRAKTSAGSHKHRKEQLTFSGLDELQVRYSDKVCIVQLDEIADIVRGGSPRPAGDPRFYDGDIPFLKVADITRNSGKFVEGYKYTIKPAGLNKTRYVDERVVLLTNSGATLGVPAILNFPATFNDGVAAFQSLSVHVHEEYLYLSLKFLSPWFLSVAARGQGQPNLNTDIIRAAWISVPAIEDQIRIVSFVDTVWEKCESAKSRIRERDSHTRALAKVLTGTA